MFTIRAVERSLFLYNQFVSAEFVYFVVSKYKGSKYFTKTNWAFQAALFIEIERRKSPKDFDSVKYGRHEQNKILQ